MLLPTAALMLGGGGWFVMTMVRSRQTVAVSTAETVVGKIGIVIRDLAPTGTVQLVSESWTAVADGDEVIAAGERVEVVGLEGLTIRVSKIRE